MRISTRRWDGTDARALAAELRAVAPQQPEIAGKVAQVIEAVRGGGDAALLDFSEQFDDARPESLWVERSELEEELRSMDRDLHDALVLAAANIEAIAQAQIRPGARWVDLPQGHLVRVRSEPVRAAAIYAPGGRAPYPSSVLMGVIPARVAGVERVVVTSPPRSEGRPHPTVLAAAALVGADAVLAAGGAQAVAALAYGTESIEPVDVIAGPGGPWVQEAKLQVSRQVGVDGYAGPSELMVICDEEAALEWIALDLCAQAEHGRDSLLVVICLDGPALELIGEYVTRAAAARPSVADAALQLVEVSDPVAAGELARWFAPEHLQVDCEGGEDIAGYVPTAGCIFGDVYGATAFGDYAAGSNHTLPTGGSGRFNGPLGPDTFTRPISEVDMGGTSPAKLAGAVETIAAAEGFPVHGESVRVRGDANDPPEQAS